MRQGLPQWQAQLERDRDGSGHFHPALSYIGLAMLAEIDTGGAARW